MVIDERVVGLPIFASDGTEVGRVAEVRFGYLKVNAPMRRDYWLSSEYVGSTPAGTVVLSVRRDEAIKARVDDLPGAATTEGRPLSGTPHVPAQNPAADSADDAGEPGETG